MTLQDLNNFVFRIAKQDWKYISIQGDQLMVTRQEGDLEVTEFLDPEFLTVINCLSDFAKGYVTLFEANANLVAEIEEIKNGGQHHFVQKETDYSFWG